MLVVLMINQTYCFDLKTKVREMFKMSNKALKPPYADLMDALNILRENQTRTAESANAMHSNEAVKSEKVVEQDYTTAYNAIITICQGDIKLLHCAYARRDYMSDHYTWWTMDDDITYHTRSFDGYKEVGYITLAKVRENFNHLLELFDRKNIDNAFDNGINHINQARKLHTLAYSTFLTSFADYPKRNYDKFKSLFKQTKRFYHELINSDKGKVLILESQDHTETMGKLEALEEFIEKRTKRELKA